MTPPDSNAVRSILVRGPNWVGDLVMSTPGFRALRDGFPRARITLHVRPGLEGLVAGSPFFDEVVLLESYHQGLPALLREASRLRVRGGFDLGLCLPDSVSSALLMRAAGVRHIVGYRRGGRGLLLHQGIDAPADWGRRRVVARERFVLGLVEALGCPEQGTRLELSVTREEDRAALAALEARHVSRDGPHVSRDRFHLLNGSPHPPLDSPDLPHDSPDLPYQRPLVAMAPGSSFGPSKRWPEACYAEVADVLVRSGARAVMVGAPVEREIGDSISRLMKEPVSNLIGEVDLGTVKALLRRSDLLICNDSGARHIAAAFAVPSIVLFGPTPLEKTNLNLEHVRIFETELPCRPCYERECPIDHACMTRTRPQSVIDAARGVLGIALE